MAGYLKRWAYRKGTHSQTERGLFNLVEAFVGVPVNDGMVFTDTSELWEVKV